MNGAPRARPLAIASAQRAGSWLALTLGSALCCASVTAETSWVTRYWAARKETNTACQQKLLAQCEQGLEALLALVDRRPDLSCLQSSVQARLGEQQAALDSLTVCVRAGLDFSSMLSPSALEAVRALPGYDRVLSSARSAEQSPSSHEVMRSLSDADLLAEDLVYNPLDRSFLISSVHERKILKVTEDGRAEDVVTTNQFPMWGVFALALEPRRQILWATTTAVPQAPPYAPSEAGRSAVLRIDLRSHTLLGRYEPSDGKEHAFGDMTLAADGTAFVADGSGGGVYAVRPGRPDPFDTVVPPGVLSSPQTPALSSDGRTLLVPDYTRGIARIDLSTRELHWLSHSPELAVYGFDGFYWRGRALLGLQNGTTPERVSVLQLDAACSRLDRLPVSLAGVPGLGDPTHGLVLGDYFYFLANSGWDRMDDDGHFRDDTSAVGAQIWRIKLPVEARGMSACRPAKSFRRKA